MDKDRIKKEAFWKVEVEGQTDRVRRLNSKRDKIRAQFETTKALMEAHSSADVVGQINSRFQARTTNVEQVFTDVTTGLVSREEYSERREILEQIADEEVQKKLLEEEKALSRGKAKKPRVDRSTLSFGEPEEEEGEERDPSRGAGAPSPTAESTAT
eukprot:RCo031810